MVVRWWLMNRQSLVAAALALVAVVAVVAAILYKTKDNRVNLEGQILKVRSHQISPEQTIVLIDMRLRNASAQSLVVRDVEVFVDADEPVPGVLFAESDIRRTLSYYPALGSRETPGLLRRDRIASGESTDRSLAISVPMTDEQLARRRAVRVVVQDVDGGSAVLVEKR
ncbi:MAG TPA: hypothetical protein VES20_03595 [Bryobacteraceae bacterium]|nr:hypothetical protein [Bryobacteraceae bacterium]